MYTAVDNIHILVICWNIVKRPFYIYYNVFCIIIPCICDVAYYYGNFDVSYISVGQISIPNCFRESWAMLPGRGGEGCVCRPLPRSLWIEFSTSENFSIDPEYVANILTSSTISAIKIYVYLPLNILLAGHNPHLVPGYMKCKLV